MSESFQPSLLSHITIGRLPMMCRRGHTYHNDTFREFTFVDVFIDKRCFLRGPLLRQQNTICVYDQRLVRFKVLRALENRRNRRYPITRNGLNLMAETRVYIT